MATITANIVISKTVAILDVPTITTLLLWIENNIRQKLPQDANLIVTLNIIP